jgi:hypothetical protein
MITAVTTSDTTQYAYISNNTAIVEGVITTVSMLVLYYPIVYVASWSGLLATRI